MIYKNGDKYEGDWSSSLRHGLGTLWIYKGGKYVVRYNGEWRDDSPNVRMGCMGCMGCPTLYGFPSVFFLLLCVLYR